MRRTLYRPLPGRGHRSSGLLVLLFVLILGLAAAPAAAARDGGYDVDGAVLAAADDHGVIVEFGSDAMVAAGESAGAAVAIGGDVIVHGEVTTAVAVGGDVIVDGRVRRTIVAVGGDARLLGRAVVGTRGDTDNTPIVLVGGKLIRTVDAAVWGDVTRVHAQWAGDAFRAAVWNPVMAPYRLNAIVPWFVQTLVLAILALIIAVTMPRQVRAVTDELRRRPWASLGWGALTSFVILPIATVIIAVTIIGLLIVVPGALIGLPLTALFGGSCVAILVGTLVLRGSASQSRGAVAALVGVSILSILRFIPVFGAVLTLLLWLFGLGAIVLAIGRWQRGRREARQAARQAGGGATAGASAATLLPAEATAVTAGDGVTAPQPATPAADAVEPPSFGASSDVPAAPEAPLAEPPAAGAPAPDEAGAEPETPDGPATRPGAETADGDPPRPPAG